MKKILIFTIPIIFSCNTTKLNKVDCNENEKFKERFFYHIQYIKNNISVLQDAKFRESIIFISNYAPVSLNEIMNYSRTYPVGVFEEDKIKWLKWYEENKCTNIQLKASHTVPDVYKDDDVSD